MSKLNPAGTELVYSTYLGGTAYTSESPQGDNALGIVVDSAGSAYVTGAAFSANFPVTTGVLQTANREPNFVATCFVTKINPAGSGLDYSTYLGGTSKVPNSYDPQVGDYCNAIQVDTSGAAYVAGSTTATDFPTSSGAFQSTNKRAPYPTPFVSKLNPAGTALTYSTYLGGSGGFYKPDSVVGIALSPSGNAYVTGSTQTSNFPVTSGAFQAINKAAPTGGNNAFISELNPTGTALVYSTLLGGSETGQANGIALDSSLNAYVTGKACSSDFPVTAGAYTSSEPVTGADPSCNAFVTKLNPAGSELVYSTYLGLSDVGSGTAIAVDSSNSAIVTGSTGDYWGPFPTTKGAFQTGDGNTFVTKLNPEGSALTYSTFLGESIQTGLVASTNAIAVDASGDVYVTGSTTIPNFPVSAGAFQPSFGGFSALVQNGWNTPDAFVTKFALGLGTPEATGTTTSLAAGSSSTYSGGAVAFTATVIDNATGKPVSSGKVTFLVNGVAVYTVPVLSNGIATYTTGSLPLGYNFITANYLGTDALDLSTALISHSVKINVAVNLKVSSAYPGGIGCVSAASAVFPAFTPTTITATVTALGSTQTPTGSVTFTDTFHPTPITLATVTLNSSGTAQFVTSSFTPGEHIIVATYSGSSTLPSATNPGYPGYILDVFPPTVVTASGNWGDATYGLPSILGVNVNASYYCTPEELAGINVQFSGAGLNFASTTATTGANGDTQVMATPTQSGAITATASVLGGVAPAIFNITARKALLHISAKNATSVYGQTPPQPTAYLLSGFLLGDTASVVSGAPALSTTVTATIPIGSYPIGVQVGTLTAANYSFSTISNGEGVLTVVRAPLYIAAKGITTTYGQAPPQPTAYTLTGFVNGETASVVSGAPALSTAVTATTPAGTYPITVGVGTLSAANYSFNTHASGEGVVQIAKAPLTIHPASVTIHAGDPLPTFTYSITGFVNGDTQASATTGTPTLTTTAPDTNTPGRYYIVANTGTLAARNYAFNQPNPATDGILTILPN